MGCKSNAKLARIQRVIFNNMYYIYRPWWHEGFATRL